MNYQDVRCTIDCAGDITAGQPTTGSFFTLALLHKRGAVYYRMCSERT